MSRCKCNKCGCKSLETSSLEAKEHLKIVGPRACLLEAVEAMIENYVGKFEIENELTCETDDYDPYEAYNFAVECFRQSVSKIKFEE